MIENTTLLVSLITKKTGWLIIIYTASAKYDNGRRYYYQGDSYSQQDQSSNRRFRTAACQIFTNISNENAVAI